MVKKSGYRLYNFAGEHGLWLATRADDNKLQLPPIPTPDILICLVTRRWTNHYNTSSFWTGSILALFGWRKRAREHLIGAAESTPSIDKAWLARHKHFKVDEAGASQVEVECVLGTGLRFSAAQTILLFISALRPFYV